MTSPTFTHLRVHSEYSIVDGLVRIDDVVAAAAAGGRMAMSHATGAGSASSRSSRVAGAGYSLRLETVIAAL